MRCNCYCICNPATLEKALIINDFWFDFLGKVNELFMECNQAVPISSSKSRNSLGFESLRC